MVLLIKGGKHNGDVTFYKFEVEKEFPKLAHSITFPATKIGITFVPKVISSLGIPHPNA